MIDRRQFFLTSLTTLTSSLLPGQLLANINRRFSIAASSPAGLEGELKLKIGDRFDVSGAGIDLATVVLSEVNPGARQIDFTQFSLSFKHHSGVELQERIYDFVHSSGKKYTLFVVSPKRSRGEKFYRVDVSLYKAQQYDTAGLSAFVA